MPVDQELFPRKATKVKMVTVTRYEDFKGGLHDHLAIARRINIEHDIRQIIGRGPNDGDVVERIAENAEAILKVMLAQYE